MIDTCDLIGGLQIASALFGAAAAISVVGRQPHQDAKAHSGRSVEGIIVRCFRCDTCQRCKAKPPERAGGGVRRGRRDTSDRFNMGADLLDYAMAV